MNNYFPGFQFKDARQEDIDLSNEADKYAAGENHAIRSFASTLLFDIKGGINLNTVEKRRRCLRAFIKLHKIGNPMTFKAIKLEFGF